MSDDITVGMTDTDHAELCAEWVAGLAAIQCEHFITTQDNPDCPYCQARQLNARHGIVDIFDRVAWQLLAMARTRERAFSDLETENREIKTHYAQLSARNQQLEDRVRQLEGAAHQDVTLPVLKQLADKVDGLEARAQADRVADAREALYEFEAHAPPNAKTDRVNNQTAAWGTHREDPLLQAVINKPGQVAAEYAALTRPDDGWDNETTAINDITTQLDEWMSDPWRLVEKQIHRGVETWAPTRWVTQQNESTTK